MWQSRSSRWLQPRIRFCPTSVRSFEMFPSSEPAKHRCNSDPARRKVPSISVDPVIPSARRAVIIGDRRVDKTGHMYEAAIRARGGSAEWVDLRVVMKAIVDVDGATLLDAATDDPTVVRVSPDNYSV